MRRPRPPRSIGAGRPGLAAELLGGRSLPNLERLLARGERAIDDATAVVRLADDLAVVGVRDARPERRSSASTSASCGRWPAASRRAPRGGRWSAEPAHFAIANDHLRLDDPRGLDVTLAEARALADAIEPRARRGRVAARSDRARDADPLDAVARRRGAVVGGGDRAARSATTSRPGSRGRPTVRRPTHGARVATPRQRDADAVVRPSGQRGARGAPVADRQHAVAVGERRAGDARCRATRRSTAGLPLLAALPVDPGATRALATFDGFVEPAPRRRLERVARRDSPRSTRGRQRARASRPTATIGVVTLVLCGRERREGRRRSGRATRRAAPALVAAPREDVARRPASPSPSA